MEVFLKTGMKIGYYNGYCVLKEAKCCKNFQFLKFWLRYGCRLHKTVTVAKAVIFFYLRKNLEVSWDRTPNLEIEKNKIFFILFFLQKGRG